MVPCFVSMMSSGAVFCQQSALESKVTLCAIGRHPILQLVAQRQQWPVWAAPDLRLCCGGRQQHVHCMCMLCVWLPGNINKGMQLICTPLVPPSPSPPSTNLSLDPPSSSPSFLLFPPPPPPPPSLSLSFLLFLPPLLIHLTVSKGNISLRVQV